jgi:tRNA modification GTPase
MSAPHRLAVRELSPRGHGAVSVIGLRGAGALDRVRVLTARTDLAPGDVRLVRVFAAGQALDSALCLVASLDEVELHVHGSPALVAALCAELGGESEAEPAEFEARARRALQRARTEAGARILLDQAEGAWRREIDALSRDADVRRLTELAERSRVARFALEPARVVLAGPVNAGKSTLFNVLAGEERAIVSAEPGTTRDVLRADAALGAYPIELFDIAGSRALAASDAAAELELAGQALARELCARADWIVWLSPHGARPPDEWAARSTAFRSRADEASDVPAEARVPLSARLEPERAARAVHTEFLARFALPEQPWRAGAAVAFDAATRRALEVALAAESESERRAVLAGSLDAR